MICPLNTSLEKVIIMKKLFGKRNKSEDEKGASSVEYVVIAALIIAVIILTIGIFGMAVKNTYDNTQKSLTGVGM